jgi:hypothetical protein
MGQWVLLALRKLLHLHVVNCFGESLPAKQAGRNKQTPATGENQIPIIFIQAEKQTK